ncbi:MAG: hypothetical protein ABUL62_18785 [Myxococcales bacterium]
MKANFGTSFAKRSLVIAATALPSLYSGLASAQAAPPPAPPPAAPVPAPPIAGDATPAAGAAVAAPPVVAPQAPAEPPAPPVAAPPPDAPPPPPPDPDAEMYKKINMGVWSRIGFGFQKADNPKKIDGVGTGGEVEFHTSGKMRKWLAWTANFAASFGAPDGGSFYPSNQIDGGPAITAALTVQDLIAQFEPDPLFNLWVGRHLVASDRSNFAGPYFMAPWIYPLKLGPQGFSNAFAVVGPKEGPYGRSDGATVWGQVQGGTFKYFLGAYDLHDAVNKPLISGRVSISLLNPEPGYWGTSTYHGMDLFSVGVGGQYSKNKDKTVKPTSTDPESDYGMVNADLLFEKKLDGGAAFDVEGAFYKYIGDGETLNFSYMGLVSYLTPELAPGSGKLQPLVRIQQAKEKSAADAGLGGANGNLVTMTDVQMNYVLDSYATRFSLGFTHASAGDGARYSNAVFLGVQLQK